MFPQMLQTGLDDFCLRPPIFFGVGYLRPLPGDFNLGSRSPHLWGKTLATYESGMAPIGTAWIQFGASDHLFALIFLAFDVDVLYLFPVLMAYQMEPDFWIIVDLLSSSFLISLTILYAWRKAVFHGSEGQRPHLHTPRIFPKSSRKVPRSGILLNRSGPGDSIRVNWPMTFGIACCSIEMMAAGWPVLTWTVSASSPAAPRTVRCYDHGRHHPPQTRTDYQDPI